MGTKNDPGEYDCYATAEPDEPMFVLLARDPVAPFLVRQWAARKKAYPPESPGPARIAEAYAVAEAMVAWRKENRGGRNDR